MMKSSLVETPAASAAAAGAAETRSAAGKYLSFLVGKEEFAIGVLSVREILGMQEITAVPHLPAHLKGVINLRGKVIPVVDLRLKFGMGHEAYTERTSIVVVDVATGKSRMMMGVVVDAVSEVLNLAAADIEDTPDFGEGVRLPFIRGVAKVKGTVKILLDIDRVVGTSELYQMAELMHH